MDVIQKNATVSTVESENPNGEFEVILSTEALDRDKENLWADEWKQPLPARIHIDGDHGRSLDKTVGSAVPRLEGNQLVAKGTFAGTPYAQMVRQLVNEGHVNSLSVTYSESKNQKGEGVQRELLNAAFVAIPANPEAVVLASKAAQLKAEGGLSASGDNPQVPKHDAMVQAIHDAAIHLGAQCLNDITADPGTADGANKSWAYDRSGKFLKSIKFVLPTYSSKEFTDEAEAWAWMRNALRAQPENEITVITKSSSSKDAGSPQETTDDSTAATADKAAATVEESADDAAQKAKAAEMQSRAIAFLISRNTSQKD